MGGDDDRAARGDRLPHRPVVIVETYLLFARKRADEALTALGSIETESAALSARAREKFGDDWLEMIAIPEGAASWAIQED